MRIVVALGGNALGNTPQEQEVRVQHAAKALCALVKEGHQLLLVHGNGPQVGQIQLAFDTARAVDHTRPFMPLAECTAMSQGYIGFHLQKGLRMVLDEAGIRTPVVTLITQVSVSGNDPAFACPTKPIGSFYSEQEAETLMEQNPGWLFREDAGRGWRRVVASPEPDEILERRSIRALLDAGNIVIACGGGGVPVQQTDHGYHSAAAVIDKDLAALKLALCVDADRLIILTAVEQVAIHYGTPEEQPLSHMRVEEAERYCEEGHFAPGSMLPKVQAAIRFAKAGGTAVIASLDRAADALSGKSGTVIRPGQEGALGGAGAAAFTGF